MKNKYIYIILCSIFIIMILLTSKACASREEIPEVQKQNLMRLGNKDVYEIEFDGVKYIVISKHNGVGICPKVEKWKMITEKFIFCFVFLYFPSLLL